MSEQTEETRNTVISVRQSDGIETQCDECPRQAHYKVSAWDEEQFLCRRHTVKRLIDATSNVEHMRYRG